MPKGEKANFLHASSVYRSGSDLDERDHIAGFRR